MAIFKQDHFHFFYFRILSMWTGLQGSGVKAVLRLEVAWPWNIWHRGEPTVCTLVYFQHLFIYLNRLSDSKVLTLRSDWKKSHQLLMLALWIAVFWPQCLFLFDIWNGRGNCCEGCIECWPSLPWRNKSDRNPLCESIDHKFFPNMNKRPWTIIQSTLEKLFWRFVYTQRKRIRKQHRWRVFHVCSIHIEKLRCRLCPVTVWVWTNDIR